MNSQPHASGNSSVWNRAINVGYDAVTSTIRRLATMVHSDGVELNTPRSRRTVPARAMQQVRHVDGQSHSDGVVSFATGFDELERILDAHRRDRVTIDIPTPSDSSSNNDDCLPGVTGVWFRQGQRCGDVDLSRGPKRGWFEMYAEKTA